LSTLSKYPICAEQTKRTKRIGWIYVIFISGSHARLPQGSLASLHRSLTLRKTKARQMGLQTPMQLVAMSSAARTVEMFSIGVSFEI